MTCTYLPLIKDNVSGCDRERQLKTTKAAIEPQNLTLLKLANVVFGLMHGSFMFPPHSRHHLGSYQIHAQGCHYPSEQRQGYHSTSSGQVAYCQGVQGCGLVAVSRGTSVCQVILRHAVGVIRFCSLYGAAGGSACRRFCLLIWRLLGRNLCRMPHLSCLVLSLDRYQKGRDAHYTLYVKSHPGRAMH